MSSHYGCRVSVGPLVAFKIWDIGLDAFGILGQHALIWRPREGDEESDGQLDVEVMAGDTLKFMHIQNLRLFLSLTERFWCFPLEGFRGV